jgi:hypothetical protein
MVAIDGVLAIPDSDTLGKYRVQQTRRSALKTREDGWWNGRVARSRCYRGLAGLDRKRTRSSRRIEEPKQATTDGLLATEAYAAAEAGENRATASVTTLLY